MPALQSDELVFRLVRMSFTNSPPLPTKEGLTVAWSLHDPPEPAGTSSSQPLLGSSRNAPLRCVRTTNGCERDWGTSEESSRTPCVGDYICTVSSVTKYSHLIGYQLPWFSTFIPRHEKFLQFDWLRAVVFQLDLKYLHVKIINLLWVVV